MAVNSPIFLFLWAESPWWLVSLDSGIVSCVFLPEDPGCFFCFLAGVPFDPLEHSRFQAIFKTSNIEVNLLHVFSDGVSTDAKIIQEGGLGKG